jgi:demethylmenaquinone methyltransferase/2-methoxy-6-polyprenyl-1,4-benzoquinol methylase
MILEFSTPTTKGVRKLYDAYSFKILPKLGEYVAKDKDSYQYLAESIRKHPTQEVLKQMVLDAGFDECQYHNLSMGIVALHRCFKY